MKRYGVINWTGSGASGARDLSEKLNASEANGWNLLSILDTPHAEKFLVFVAEVGDPVTQQQPGPLPQSPQGARRPGPNQRGFQPPPDSQVGQLEVKTARSWDESTSRGPVPADPPESPGLPPPGRFIVPG